MSLLKKYQKFPLGQEVIFWSVSESCPVAKGMVARCPPPADTQMTLSVKYGCTVGLFSARLEKETQPFVRCLSSEVGESKTARDSEGVGNEREKERKREKAGGREEWCILLFHAQKRIENH